MAVQEAGDSGQQVLLTELRRREHRLQTRVAGIRRGGNSAENKADRNLLGFRTIKLCALKARVCEARQRTALRSCDAPGPSTQHNEEGVQVGQSGRREK